ncbi:MAG TPA: maleylpyruvate isomerase family mycothiol-dependent enzyme [Acidimicrobiales bacterium]
MEPSATDVTGKEPLSHEQAMQLQTVELQRAVDLLRSLEDADWTAQTDCPDWDVRRMYLHVLGALDAAASMKENVHQMRAGMRHRKANGGPLEAGLSSVQVRERIEMTPTQLVERFAAVAPVAVRKRTNLPSAIRKAKLKVDGPVIEKWALGYLIDTIYLRDLWMHRVDATRATGREMVLTADHDGVIVADVVAEWARRHGQPFTLTLTGPAGGTFTAGGGAAEGEGTELDAVEFCRILAGRAEATGLLTTIVPF